MYYDFWIEEHDGKLLKKLGFHSACVVSENLSKGREFSGVKVFAKTTKELRKKLSIVKEADFIILDSHNEKIVETAVQMNAIDAVTLHAKYPLIARMAEKNIAQIINFNELLNAPENKTAGILNMMQRSARLAVKHKAPLLIVSGARNKMELRSVSDLIGFGEMIGLTQKEAKEALNKHQIKLLKRAELKKEGRWIRPGVELISKEEQQCQ